MYHKNTLKIKTGLIVASLTLAGNVLAEKWNNSNNPFNFNYIAKKQFSAVFDELPMEARLRDDRLGWSENFWPSN